ncbi:MAG: putative rane protein [Gemmatimonadales bacterium]|jgi:putative membrane protein|nr:putative rane protein [Gemmatimonadales bacterium]
MSKRYLTFAAIPVALALTALTAVSSTVAAQQDAAVAPAPALDDPTIVAIFDNANSFDIETGKLAAKRGHSNEVRQFGAMLARDHDMVRQQGRDLAKKLGVTPTPPAGDQSARDQAATLHRLAGLRGAEFDRAFLQHEATFHRDVIAAVKSTLLPAIKNEELKALVVKVAPAFQAHLDMAENLSKRVATK